MARRIALTFLPEARVKKGAANDMAVTGLLNGKLYKKTNRDEVYYFAWDERLHWPSVKRRSHE